MAAFIPIWFIDCRIEEKQMTEFFLNLKKQGLNLKSCTVDGNPQVIKVLPKIWPNITIQRCLVHIQRQGVMWCRHKPKRIDSKYLRKIFLKIPYIKTRKQLDLFLKEVSLWEKKFGDSILNRPERGKVFSDLKRARSMLFKAMPHMFHFLDNPYIPHTTNAIEGYFSRLKRHYRNHRGLSPKKRADYFKWYFFLKSK